MRHWELEIISRLLALAAKEFSNSGCNYFEIPEDVPGKEVRELVLKVIDDPVFHRDCDDKTNNQLRHVLDDYILMRHYSKYLGNFVRHLKKWEAELKAMELSLTGEGKENQRTE